MAGRPMDVANDAVLSLEEQAAQWFARMANDMVSEEDVRAFRNWREASPSRAAEYHRLASAWECTNRHADAPRIVEMRLAALADGPTKPASRRWVGMAAAITLILSVTALLGLSVTGVFPWSASSEGGTQPQVAQANSPAGAQATLAADSVGANAGLAPFSSSYSTRIGEMAEFNLPDGSSIALNTGSKVEVSYTAGRRMLTLAKGEALFTVAKDASRPFIVNAGNSRVVALGTIFAVRRTGDVANVTLIEGRVRVDKTGSRKPGSQSAELTAGEQLTIGADLSFAISKTELASAASWRDGRLVFDNTPLRDVLDEFNRYSVEQHVLRDPALADYLVSGTFRIKSSEHFAATLEAGFPIIVRATDGGRLLEVTAAQEKR